MKRARDDDYVLDPYGVFITKRALNIARGSYLNHIYKTWRVKAFRKWKAIIPPRTPPQPIRTVQVQTRWTDPPNTPYV